MPPINICTTYVVEITILHSFDLFVRLKRSS